MQESGLNRFFGPLEAKIMDILWDNEQMTIKEVQSVLEKEKSTNFNTVMTVMNRLVEKGILDRKVVGRSSYYNPIQSRQDFLNTQSKEMTHELMDEFGNVVVSHMLDALEDVDDDLVAKLELKIKELKRINAMNKCQSTKMFFLSIVISGTILIQMIAYLIALLSGTNLNFNIIEVCQNTLKMIGLTSLQYAVDILVLSTVLFPYGKLAPK